MKFKTNFLKLILISTSILSIAEIYGIEIKNNSKSNSILNSSINSKIENKLNSNIQNSTNLPIIDPNVEIIENSLNDGKSSKINIKINWGEQKNDITQYRIIVFPGKEEKPFSNVFNDLSSASMIYDSFIVPVNDSNPLQETFTLDLNNLTPGLDFDYTIFVGSKINNFNWCISDSLESSIKTEHTNVSLDQFEIIENSWNSFTFHYKFDGKVDSIGSIPESKVHFVLKDESGEEISYEDKNDFSGDVTFYNLNPKTNYKIDATVTTTTFNEVISNEPTLFTYDMPEQNVSTLEINPLIIYSFDVDSNSIESKSATVNWNLINNDEEVSKQTLTITDVDNQITLPEINIDPLLRTYNLTDLQPDTNYSIELSIETNPLNDQPITKKSSQFKTKFDEMILNDLEIKNTNENSTNILWNIDLNDEFIESMKLSISNLTDPSIADKTYIINNPTLEGNFSVTGLNSHTHYSAILEITKTNGSIIKTNPAEFWTKQSLPIFDTKSTKASGGMHTNIEWNIIDSTNKTIDNSLINSISLKLNDSSNNLIDTYLLDESYNVGQGNIEIADGMKIGDKIISLDKNTEYHWQILASINIDGESNDYNLPPKIQENIESRQLSSMINEFNDATFLSDPTYSIETPNLGNRQIKINYNLILNDATFSKVELIDKNDIVLDKFIPEDSTNSNDANEFILDSKPGDIVEGLKIKVSLLEYIDPVSNNIVKENRTLDYSFPTINVDDIKPVLMNEPTYKINDNVATISWGSIDMGENNFDHILISSDDGSINELIYSPNEGSISIDVSESTVYNLNFVVYGSRICDSPESINILYKTSISFTTDKVRKESIPAITIGILFEIFIIFFVFAAAFYIIKNEIFKMTK